MNGNRRLFTFIVVPGDSREMRRFRVTARGLYAALAVFVLLAAVILYGAFRLVSTSMQLSSHEETLVRVQQLMEENARFRGETGRMAEKIAYMEGMAMTISRLSGIDIGSALSATGGTGGFGYAPFGQVADRNGLGQLPQLSRRLDLLEDTLVRLKSETLERSIFRSSLPKAWPALGYISSWYGGRPDPFSGGREFHTGIDISAPTGTRVSSTGDGIVLFAGVQSGYGYTVIVSHGYGIATRYAHLSAMMVRVGQPVKMGDTIGLVGNTGRSTGPHLHYEVIVDGRPVNPFLFLNGKKLS